MRKILTIIMILLIALSSMFFAPKVEAESGSITGRVIDYLTHSGVRLANIELDDENGNVVASTTADENGYYSISSIPAGYYYVYAWNGSWGVEYHIKVFAGQILSLTLELVPYPRDDWHWCIYVDLYEAIQTVSPGETASFPVHLTAQTGYAANFTFSADALPPSSTYAFDPPWLFYYGDTTLTVNVSPSTPIGTYHILVIATEVLPPDPYPPDLVPGVMGIGVTLIISGPSPPDFEISVSPEPHIVVHVGGWNDSISLILKSINGFSGSIQLSFSGPSEANIYIGFTQNPVYLSAGSQVIVEMIVSSTSAALSEYPFVIVAEGDSIRHEVSLSIKLVGNSAAITNIVHLQEIAASDPPFSIQQNFMIAAPNGTAIYWGQNIIQIGRNIPILSRRIAISIFQVFAKPDWKTIVINEKRGILAPKLVSFPVVFNLTSYIEGNTLILENNASFWFNTARLSLPEGSYIIGYAGSGYGFTHQAPEIAIVGLPFQKYLKVATFRNPTRGSIESYVRLVGESDRRQTQNVILNLENYPQTAEESRNLKWLSDGTFQYSNGSTDQGITFSPNYH